MYDKNRRPKGFLASERYIAKVGAMFAKASELNTAHGPCHTSYLSFFLHGQNFKRVKFTPKFTQ